MSTSPGMSSFENAYASASARNLWWSCIILIVFAACSLAYASARNSVAVRIPRATSSRLWLCGFV